MRTVKAVSLIGSILLVLAVILPAKARPYGEFCVVFDAVYSIATNEVLNVVKSNELQ
jgi:hypothetical protein